jgi:iron complex outermembrane recepter protein
VEVRSRSESSSSRVRRTLLLAGAASLLLANAAAAQTARTTQANDASEVEEVVVTGSQLRGVPPVGSALVSVGQDEIRASGAISTVQILNEVPQIFNIGKSETSRGNTGGNSNITYGSSINIRGLSPYATLVLLDGHRMVRQEPRAESVDPSHVPTNMIQRVEVVADGSSAIYGSDAIAGVANLILRRRFDGQEALVSYGQSNIGNYQEYLGQLTFGRTFERGQFTAGVEYMYHSNLAMEHQPYNTRDQVRFGGSDIRTTNCFPGNIQIGNTFFPIPEGGVTPANANQLVAGPPRRCELFKTADVTPEQERVSFAFTFDYEITDRIAFYSMGYASHRHFNIYNTPAALTLTVPSTNAFYVAPPGVTVPLCSAAVNARFGTPAGTRCLTVLHNVINDVGTQNPVTGFATPYEIIAGFRIDLPREWQLSIDHTHGLNAERGFDRSYFRTHAANLDRALASSNPATAINVFGGKSPRAVIDNTSPIGVFNQVFDPGGHTILNVTAAKVDGPLFTLPGGKVRMALGVQRDRMDWWSNNATGPLTAPLFSTPQRAERWNDSIFAEVNIPVVGPDNQLPFVQSLDVNIAGRQDTYNDVGRTRNPKVGFRWVPLDGLTVHGSYGTSFRSPNVLDLYQIGNNLNVNSALFDPTVGRGVVAISLSGGNPNVKPETAKTWSLGFDYSPEFLPGLRVGVNYFNLQVENQIGAFLSDGQVLQKEAELAGTGIITRVPNVEYVQNLLVGKVVTSGTLPADLTLVRIVLDGRPLNLGGTRTSGFDINGTYDIPTDEWGNFRLGVIGILFNKYEDQVTPRSPWIDRLNHIFFPPKWRARYYLDWNQGPWRARLTYNYLNPYTNTLVPERPEIKRTTTTDLHVAYKLGQPGFAPWARDAEIALDVTNLFDQDPPTVIGTGAGVFGATNATSSNTGAGYDPTKGYALGRLIAVSVRSRF